jgi:hypothetical protein
MDRPEADKADFPQEDTFNFLWGELFNRRVLTAQERETLERWSLLLERVTELRSELHWLKDWLWEDYQYHRDELWEHEGVYKLIKQDMDRAGQGLSPTITLEKTIEALEKKVDQTRANCLYRP